MVPVAIAGNISGKATTPSGNIFNEATRGIEWFDLKTGEIHQAWVFVAVLGFSQLLYARAAEDMQSRNWLGCHRRMFAFYGGVPT